MGRKREPGITYKAALEKWSETGAAYRDAQQEMFWQVMRQNTLIDKIKIAAEHDRMDIVREALEEIAAPRET